MAAKHLVKLRIIFLLSLCVSALTSGGQNLEIPQNEFALSFPSNQLKLTRGENGELEIAILKSKSSGKSKVKMGVSSALPKGVTVIFDPDNGYFDVAKARISVQPDAIPGQYWLILSATVNNKTKGTILKLLIN
jgi:hypothetical protein